jgi:nicotinamide-nucleotide amidase
METTLVIVGKSLQINKPFLDYIDSQIYLCVKTPKKKIFLDKNDTNIFLLLEQIIDKTEQTIIIASKDSFNLIGKVLSTLNEDELELKDNMLIPSKAKDYTVGSYLLKYNNKIINIIEAQETLVLPKILIKAKEELSLFTLIGLDEDSTKILLEPLANTYEIKLNSTSIVDGWSLIEASTYKYGNIKHFLKAVKSLFPDKFINNDNIIEHIISSLEKENKTVSIAESCTGGEIASMITSMTGSSSIFAGSIVSYSNDIKKSWLGVQNDTLEKFGAVSELCIREMLEGVLNASKSDFAMATSGVAGPMGGSKEKPVGTVFVGARSKNGEVIVERLLLQGDRNYIQKQSAYHALQLLLRVGKNIFFKKS